MLQVNAETEKKIGVAKIMKKARLYIDSTYYTWYCTKCGKPNGFSVQPSGIYTLNGKLLASKSAIKKGYFITSCTRTHLAVPNCKGKRKIVLKDGMLKGQIDKFCKKMNDRHTEHLKMEDKERNAQHESEIKKRVLAEIKKEKKERRKQKKLFEKSKKKKRKK